MWKLLKSQQERQDNYTGHPARKEFCLQPRAVVGTWQKIKTEKHERLDSLWHDWPNLPCMHLLLLKLPG